MNSIFAENLDRLLTIRHLSRKQAAEAIGIPYKWLRRAVTHGVARKERRNVEFLQRIVEFFGLNSVDDLWRDNLIELRIGDEQTRLRRAVSESDRRQSCHAKLDDLLDHPRFTYLMDVIERLHDRVQSAALKKADVPGVRGKPLIKWMGSKRRQADTIISHFPQEIRTYYEPFLGGGAMLYRLLSSDIQVDRYECSDICEPLIGIWDLVQRDPGQLLEEYERHRLMLLTKGERYFREARTSFNETQDPCEFFFLLRTCRLGHIRFNRRGQFTSAFNHGRTGVSAAALEPVIADWHSILNSAKVRFSVKDYRQVRSQPGDLLYLDPPYPTIQMYYGRLDFPAFFKWLQGQEGDWLLSLNGFSGFDKPFVAVPPHLFDTQIDIDAGVNPFTRLQGDIGPESTDALYIKSHTPKPLVVNAASVAPYI